MFVEQSDGVRTSRLKRISELESCNDLGNSLEKMNELGALYYAENRVQEALNIFYKVLREDPANVSANGYVQLIRGVLDFVNKDLMNP